MTREQFSHARQWAVEILVLVLVGFASWTALAIIDHGQRLARSEAMQLKSEEQDRMLASWLTRVETKLDRALLLRYPMP